METALQVEHLCVKLGSFQLKDLSLTLPAGSVMGLIGRNAAGKTTFLNSILDLHDGTGNVSFYGKKLKKNRIQVCQDIAYVPAVSDHPNNIKIKKLCSIEQSFYPNFAMALMRKLCDAGSIDMNVYPSKLSLGQQKLLQLSMAICRRPRLLILDEPMANLDPITRRKIMDLLLKFMEKEDHAILISSHLLSDLEKIMDEVVLMDQGTFRLQENINRLQEYYYEVVCSKEEREHLDPGIIIGEQTGGLLCCVKDEKELMGLRHQRADLETIMCYVCGRSAAK